MFESSTSDSHIPFVSDYTPNLTVIGIIFIIIPPQTLWPNQNVNAHITRINQITSTVFWLMRCWRGLSLNNLRMNKFIEKEFSITLCVELINFDNSPQRVTSFIVIVPQLFWFVADAISSASRVFSLNPLTLLIFTHEIIVFDKPKSTVSFQKTSSRAFNFQLISELLNHLLQFARETHLILTPITTIFR